MNYRIEEKEAFEIFGLELKTTVANGQCYNDIPEFWSACVNDGRFQALIQDAGKHPGQLIDAGVTYAHDLFSKQNGLVNKTIKSSMKYGKEFMLNGFLSQAMNTLIVTLI